MFSKIEVCRVRMHFLAAAARASYTRTDNEEKRMAEIYQQFGSSQIWIVVSYKAYVLVRGHAYL